MTAQLPTSLGRSDVAVLAMPRIGRSKVGTIFHFRVLAERRGVAGSVQLGVPTASGLGPYRDGARQINLVFVAWSRTGTTTRAFTVADPAPMAGTVADPAPMAGPSAPGQLSPSPVLGPASLGVSPVGAEATLSRWSVRARGSESAQAATVSLGSPYEDDRSYTVSTSEGVTASTPGRDGLVRYLDSDFLYGKLETLDEPLGCVDVTRYLVEPTHAFGDVLIGPGSPPAIPCGACTADPYNDWSIDGYPSYVETDHSYAAGTELATTPLRFHEVTGFSSDFHEFSRIGDATTFGKSDVCGNDGPPSAAAILSGTLN